MLPDTLPQTSAPAPRRGRGVAIGVGGIAVLLAALDAYVVVTLLVSIAADMHIAVNNLQLATPIVTGFLFGYVAGMPLLGGLSDRFSRRALIQVCLAGFLAGSAITALATSMPVLVAGRGLQGLAGGALLPVTMALVADLWAEHRRPVVLGAIGAAQELGSVLGPLYGAVLAGYIGWRGVFWVNIPIAVVAMLLVQLFVPGRRAADPAGVDAPRRRVDVVGGVLLAISLGLLVVGLYNEDPQRSALPPWGPMTLAAGGGVFLLFLLWEWRARTKLVDLTGGAKGAFFATVLASFIAGAALLVTLVDVQLIAQTLLARDEGSAALLLARFLAALPVGAIVGGVLAPRVGNAVVSAIGFLVAAGAYWLISGWPMDVLAARYEVAGVSVPRFDTDLILAGLGLGLVIAPLSAAVLRAVSDAQHGIASAAVVVARTMGMLIGFAALTSWGLHRFQQLTADLVPPFPTGGLTAEYQRQLVEYNQALQVALLREYHEIFLITAVACVVGALVSLAISRRPRP